MEREDVLWYMTSRTFSAEVRRLIGTWKNTSLHQFRGAAKGDKERSALNGKGIQSRKSEDSNGADEKKGWVEKGNHKDNGKMLKDCIT